LATKDVVVGLGEIGLPLLELISKATNVIGYDKNPNLIDKKKYDKNKKNKTSLLHICIPYTKKFIKDISSLYNKFHPECIVIHSTVSPYTTEKLQRILKIPVIYSTTRGVHRRMIKDLQKYTKFYSIYDWAPKARWSSKVYSNRMKKAGIKTKKMSSPLVLELAKILVDTSYYGWLINYAQLSNMIAIQNKVDYDEMWSFADEIHEQLGNRPKMFPGFIGGHCVIPNLDLMHNDTLNLIKKINNSYSKKVKNSKSIFRKYSK